MEIQFLAPDEPGPVTVINEESESPVLFLCDHATPFIPRAMQKLGVEDHHLNRHVAYDIGIKAVTEGLANHFGARAIFSNFSRLIVDPNRKLDNETLIPEVSDGCAVPANMNLCPKEREARLQTFYWPYQNTIATTLDRMLDAGQVPVIISMHSMTHEMNGEPRPWMISALWNEDDRIPVPFMERLQARGIPCGDNVPYSGRDGHGYTMETHADKRGLPNLLIEVRQDLIGHEAGVAEWTATLAEVLEETLSCPSLREIRKPA